jgi:aspartate/methionine/tyrosine aminotransferase
MDSLPGRLARLAMPERTPLLGQSLREAERELERLAGGPNLLDLTYADTKRFPPPTWVLEDFLSAANGRGMTYTPYRGDRSVRGDVADHVSRFLGVPVDAERELILTPGTQAALFTALAAVVDTGDTVLLVDPDYLSSERMLRFLGATVEHVPLRWEEGDPTVDMDALEQALRRRPRLLLFSHPNNPTGAVYGGQVITRIAALAEQHGVLIVVDELYARLVYDDRSFAHLIAQPGAKDRCVTLVGPSKTESMSGYRVGAAVAPAAIVERMEDVLSIIALRAPSYAQHTLTRWLSEDHEFVTRRIADYQRLRDLTVARLNRSSAVSVIPAGGTAYLFPRVVGIDASDQDVAKRLLGDAAVVVNPGYQFGPRGEHHFRICFAQDEKIWPQALDRMVGAIEAMRSGR